MKNRNGSIHIQIPLDGLCRFHVTQYTSQSTFEGALCYGITLTTCMLGGSIRNAETLGRACLFEMLTDAVSYARKSLGYLHIYLQWLRRATSTITSLSFIKILVYELPKIKTSVLLV